MSLRGSGSAVAIKFGMAETRPHLDCCQAVRLCCLFTIPAQQVLNQHHLQERTANIYCVASTCSVASSAVDAVTAILRGQ